MRQSPEAGPVLSPESRRDKPPSFCHLPCLWMLVLLSFHHPPCLSSALAHFESPPFFPDGAITFFHPLPHFGGPSASPVGGLCLEVARDMPPIPRVQGCRPPSRIGGGPLSSRKVFSPPWPPSLAVPLLQRPWPPSHRQQLVQRLDLSGGSFCIFWMESEAVWLQGD